MFKPIHIIGIAVFFILSLFSLGFCQESMTITTYYPSPYGSYNQLYVEDDFGIGTTSPGTFGSQTGNFDKYIDVIGSTQGVTLGLGTNRTIDGTLGDVAYYNTAIGGSGSDNRVGMLRFTRSGANNSGQFDLWTRNAGTYVDAMTVTSAGNVGIGISPTYKLQLSIDSAGKPGANTWTIVSDRRLKKNIKPLKGALDKMLRLRGVTFQWKEPKKQGNLTGTYMGLIGQEVEKVFPEWVGTDQDGYKNLTVGGFEALTAEAIKELKAENDALQARIKALEAKLAKK